MDPRVYKISYCDSGVFWKYFMVTKQYCQYIKHDEKDEHLHICKLYLTLEEMNLKYTLVKEMAIELKF